jgi:hypothetical protein
MVGDKRGRQLAVGVLVFFILTAGIPPGWAETSEVNFDTVFHLS